MSRSRVVSPSCYTGNVDDNQADESGGDGDPGQGQGSGPEAEGSEGQPAVSVRGVVRRKEAGRGLVAVRGGCYAQRYKQVVEVEPDRGRERAAAADRPGLRQLRLR